MAAHLDHHLASSSVNSGPKLLFTSGAEEVVGEMPKRSHFPVNEAFLLHYENWASEGP